MFPEKKLHSNWHHSFLTKTTLFVHESEKLIEYRKEREINAFFVRYQVVGEWLRFLHELMSIGIDRCPSRESVNKSPGSPRKNLPGTHDRDSLGIF